MSAHLVQARLGAAARIATTAILALLLLVAGWTPARVLPALTASHAAQAAGALAGSDAARLAEGLRTANAATQVQDQTSDAGLPTRRSTLPAFASATGSGRPLPARAGHSRACHQPRAPPTTA